MATTVEQQPIPSEEETPQCKRIMHKLKNKVGGVAQVARMSTEEKSSTLAMQNKRDVSDYKKDFTSRSFKPRKPSRGMSQLNRPQQLRSFIGVSSEEIDCPTSSVVPKSKDDIEIIQQAISRNFFFHNLTKDEKRSLVESFEQIKAAREDVIMKQGDRADYFYVIASGRVEFVLDGNSVGTAAKHDSFGELALLYSCRRAATVLVDSSHVVLFRVDKKTFVSLLRKQTKLCEKKKLALVRSIDYFEAMSRDDRKLLSGALRSRQFEKGECLVPNGSKCDTFYIVHEGKLQVSKQSTTRKKPETIILKAGECVGEQSLRLREPWSGTLTALTNGSAFCIDRKVFERLFGSFSRVAIKAKDQRLLEQVELLSASKLKSFEYEELASLVIDRTFDAGKAIFLSGRKTRSALYLVREGAVQLSGERSEIIHAGEYFGEELLLLDAKQSHRKDKRSTTRIAPTYSAKAINRCSLGLLTLSECRTIFDTKKLGGTAIGTIAGARNDGCEILSPTQLKRETTRQWLARSSIADLRTCVRNNIGLGDLKRHTVLGEGNFGEVHLVSTKIPGTIGRQYFALKQQLKDDPARMDSLDAIESEIDVMRAMDHPYIVSLIHRYEDPDNINILMGVVYGGELFDVIHSENEDGTWSSGLPESDSKFYAMVITDTLDYIHRRRYVFRDLKPENVLIDKEGYPIICDFGFAKMVTDKTYTICGTPNYLSPEVLTSRGHNQSSDHWALGVLIYEMIAGENPFFYDGMPQMELFKNIASGEFYPLPDFVSDEAFRVVEGLLRTDPTNRLGSSSRKGKEIITMDWFSELDLDETRQKTVKAPFVPKNHVLDEMMQLAPFQEEEDLKMADLVSPAKVEEFDKAVVTLMESSTLNTCCL